MSEAQPKIVSLSYSSEGVPPFRAEIWKLLVLAAPAVGAKFSHMALGFTDFIFVSTLGTDATAAISPATLFAFLILCLGMGCVTGIQTFAAQALGRREPHRAAPYVWQAFYIGAFFLLLTWPAILCLRPFWTWVGHPPAVREMEIAFCQIDLWSMGLAIMCVGLESFFNGIQKPGVALASVVVAIAVNAIGDYALVFGHLGFPAMGVAGSALATVFAWSVRVAMMLTVYLSHRINEEFRTRESWRLNFARLREVLTMGGPIGIQWVLDVGAWFAFLTLMMAKFSTAALAAANIALQFMHLSFMPAIGIGIGVNSLVGHAIGAKRHDLAVRHARAGLAVMMTYMFAAALLYWLGGERLMALLSSDTEVIALGAGMLVWAAVFQIFDAMGINYIFALRGAGDTKWPSVLVIFHCWVTFILGGQIAMRLLPGMGIHAPWMMCTLYIILLGLSLWRRWERGKWKKIELFKGEPSHEPGVAIDTAEAVPALTADT